MNMKTVTISGKAAQMGMSDAVFGLRHSPLIVAQAVRVYLSNQRQGGAKVKTRGEVDRTKKKWYKQKGTGNARHGARSANIFVGGGVSHGPNGMQNWKLKMSKPMRTIAIQTALALQAKEGNVIAVQDLENISNKTKDVVKMLTAVGVNNDRILVVTDTTLENFIRASRNVGSVLCTRVDRMNAYEIMSAHKILVTPGALAALEEKFGTGEEMSAEKPAKTAKKTVKKAPVAKAEKKPVKKAVKKTAKKA